MGWTLDPATGDGAWVKHNGAGLRGPGGLVINGSYAAMFTNTYEFGTQGSITTPAFNLTNAVDPVISFYWWNGDPAVNPSKILVQTSVDGTTFDTIDTINANQCPYHSWSEYVRLLPLNVVKVRLTGVSDQGVADTYVDYFSIAELGTSPIAQVNYQRVDFGPRQINGQYNVFGNIFELKNISGDTLRVTGTTDLSQTAFSTNFDPSISLSALQSHLFNFSYHPISAGNDSVRFEIFTNGGTVAIDLIGQAYQTPENIIEIGYNNLTEKNLPTDPGTKLSYTQSLFLQEEINRPGSQINKIYYYNNGYSGFTRNLTVYLGHTTADSLTAWVPLSALTEVFSGMVEFTAQPGWVEIPFTFPFAYNNTDNLVIAVDDNTALTAYQNHFFCTESTSPKSIYCKNSSTNPNPASPPNIGTGYSDAKTSYFRPNIRLDISPVSSTAIAVINKNAADYGSARTGTSSDLIGNTFILKNTGNQPLVINSITNLAGTAFSTNLNQSASLNHNETLQFGFTFHPSSVGIHETIFQIDTNGGIIDITLTGFAYDLPVEVAEIGIQSTLSQLMPVNSSKRYSYTQSLFLNSELANSLSQIGKISYHFNGENNWSGNVKIFMGHTTANTLEAWVTSGNMTLVYDGLVQLTNQNSWSEILLHTPFNYNHTDNLVISVYKEMSATVSNNNFFVTDAGQNMSIVYSNASTNPDPANPPAIGTTSTTANRSVFRPNIRVQFQNEVSTPVAALSRYSADYGFIKSGLTSDPIGQTFRLVNAGTGILTINSVTDLSNAEFTTTLIPSEVQLNAGQSYSFGFTYAPVNGGTDTLVYEIQTNGGSAFITLTGQAYQLPEGMIEIGTGISTNQNLALDITNNYSYTQSIFLQSELNTANQQINSILFNYKAPSTPFSTNAVIYMGHTSQSALTTWVPFDQLTKVFEGNISISQPDGWKEIVLQIPFIYNNTDNLVVAIYKNEPGSTYGTNANCTLGTTNQSIYFKNYSINPDLLNPPAVGTSANQAKLSLYRPDIRLQFHDIYTQAVVQINKTASYLGYTSLDSPIYPVENQFNIFNSGTGILTVSAVSGLINTAFSCNLVADSVHLATGESYAFDFTFNPQSEGHHETTVLISTNGGSVSINLSGDAYQLNGNEIQIGEGNTYSSIIPASFSTYKSYSQTLVKQSEINISNHKINRIFFDYAGQVALTDTIHIYLGHTSLNVLNDWIPLDSLTEVFNGQIELFSDSNWVAVDLDTPFIYNNQDNLLIAVYKNSSVKQSVYNSFYTNENPVNMCISCSGDNFNIDPQNPPALSFNTDGARPSVYRPNMMLGMVLAPLAPYNLTATLEDNNVQLNWSNPYGRTRKQKNGQDRDLTAFRIYRNNEMIANVSADTLQFNDQELTPGTYVYGVSALYGEIESDQDTVSVVIEPELLNPPVNLTAQVKTRRLL